MSDDSVAAARMDLERARHQIAKQFRQPGNDYVLEARCRCGWWGRAIDFDEHRAQAVLDAAEASADASS